ncbi:MAG: hypothetical protein RL015_3424, partial [Verrucomicrobiota bacterium]
MVSLSLSGEKAALHECVNQVIHTKPIRCARIEHRLDFFAICESHGRAGGVEGEVIEEVFGELARVGGEEAFEFVDVFEGFT